MITKLAKLQSMFSFTVFTLVIISSSLYGHWNLMYSFNNGLEGSLALMVLILSTIVLIMGMSQVVYGIIKDSKTSIIAGIFGIVTLYSWISIFTFIINLTLYKAEDKR